MGFPDGRFRYVPAVGPSRDAEALGADLGITAERLGHGPHQVLVIRAAPVQHDRAREGLAVPLGPAWIREENVEPGAREDLKLMEEAGTVLDPGSPMDLKHHGVLPLLTGVRPTGLRRLQHPALDLVPLGHFDPELFRRPDLKRVEEFWVEMPE